MTIVIVAGVALATGLIGDDGPQRFTVGASGAQTVAIADAARASGAAFDARIDVERLPDAAGARAATILREAGLSAADARRALAPPALELRSVGGGPDDARRGVAFVASLLLYLQLIVFGLAVASGVVAEKASRVVEVLPAAVPPRALLAGKIVGIGLLGLAQLVLVVVVGLAVASASGALELESGDAGALAVVIVVRVRLSAAVRRSMRSPA